MIVSEFTESSKFYEGFEVWEVESLDDFFEGNEILSTIFQDVFAFGVEELKERRSEIEHDDLAIMNNMLSLVNDKSFFIFTLHDENHLELVAMQQMKVMNFGLDIEKIKNDRVYVMIMDKKA